MGPPYGYTKIPTIWVYRLRDTFACDGSIQGDRAIALAAVEFNKGMEPDEIIRRLPLWESLYAYLRELRPPAYPGQIDDALAQRGSEVFASSCSECHGTYDGNIEYTESVIPLDEIGTDANRLHAMSEELVRQRRRSPLADQMKVEITAGYVPPPLEGIWCRGPFLHNGSVPALEDLLRPPPDRPVRFFGGGDTEYDVQRLGLRYEEEAVDGQRAGRRFSERQYLFDTQADANDNQGHEFGTDLPAEDKRALLEYLKTL